MKYLTKGTHGLVAREAQKGQAEYQAALKLHKGLLELRHAIERLDAIVPIALRPAMDVFKQETLLAHTLGVL
jgi:hypothetical protein